MDLSTTSPTSPDVRIAADPIIQVPAGRVLTALREVVVMGREPDAAGAQRFIQYAASQNLALDQCWAVENPDGRLRPALIALPNHGHTAMIFTSPPRNRDEVAALARLIEHSVAHLDRPRVALAQVLLTREEKLVREAFEAAGFQYLADLAYLDRNLPRLPRPPVARWPEGCTIETWRPVLLDDFKRALTASYEDTRDCPALCGLRSIDDVMADHLGAGVADPELWTLVRRRGEPAAALLVNPLPDGQTVELSYLGVGARHRRLGLGRLLMDHALHLLSRRPFTRFTLAVDEANTPAVNLYKSLGFHRSERRVAMIHPIH